MIYFYIQKGDNFCDEIIKFVMESSFLYRVHTEKFIQNSQTSHKLCNMGQKSNTKVCNSATHLVKGHNPYCSQRLMHFISQN